MHIHFLLEEPSAEAFLQGMLGKLLPIDCTWEALERALREAGHFSGGLRKIEAAREMAKHMNPQGNRSVSFEHFVKGLATLGSATA